jgi:uncharacterized metal-binding protein
MTPSPPDRLPLVYSCSGSSNVAQLANAVAVRLDRAGRAEMSCIAGVGGGVRPLVRKARSGRRIVVVDGCPLRCCEAALAAQGVVADHAVRLHERGLRKRQHVDFSPAELDTVYAELLVELDPVLGGAALEPSEGHASA